MNGVFNNLTTVIQEWWQNLITSLPQLITGLIIFILSLYLARFLSSLTAKALARRNPDKETNILISRLVRWSVISFGIVLALQQAGQDVSALLTGLGILGFTVGFALQDVSANFIAGILLLFSQPFDIGDSIEVSGYSGTVQDINLRATELLAFDGRLVLIPNSDVFTSAIINYTRTNRRRVELNVGVGYDSDLEQVTEVALQAIANLPGVIEDPAPQVVFKEFGDAAINMTLYYWYSTERNGFFEAQDYGVRLIKTAFEAAGIEIPYPIQTIYTHKV